MNEIDFHELTSDNMMQHMQNVFVRHVEDLKLLLLSKGAENVVGLDFPNVKELNRT